MRNIFAHHNDSGERKKPKMLDIGNGGLEISAFTWQGTAEKAHVNKAGDTVAEIVRKGPLYKVRVYPTPAFKDHWVGMEFRTEEAAIAGIVGAMAVIEDKSEEGLF